MPDRTPTRVEELEAIRERDRAHQEAKTIGRFASSLPEQDRHDLLARLDEAERERVRLRAAAQAVGADMDDVDFYGDPQKWPLVLNIGREPLAALAAALEDRDAK